MVFSVEIPPNFRLEFTFIDLGDFHKVFLQAKLKRRVAMDWQRDSCRMAGFCINVVTSLYPSQFPTFFLDQFCEFLP